MGAFSQGPVNPMTFSSRFVMAQRINEFFVDTHPPPKHSLTGVSRDATGAALGNCTVEVYETISAANLNEPKGRFVGSTVSDASGNYSVDVYAAPGATFRVLMYLAGSPDRAGTSLNTLVGT